MSRRDCNRLLVLLLAFLILIEPVALPVLRAAELPAPTINTENIPGIVNLDEVVAPADYLEYIMRLRGQTREDAEARAWGEWMMMLNSTYLLMDDGASDVFSFYEAMKILRENSTVLADVSDVVKTVIRFTTLGFSFAFRSRLMAETSNLIIGFMRLTNMAKAAQDWVDNNKVLDFMEFTAPPPCWNNPEVAGEGFKSYWRWVQNKTGKSNVASELSDSRGVARSFGVGLVIVGLAIDAWGIARSEDRSVGRTSYALTKHYVGAVLGLASLVAMFCTPFIGQIVLIAGFVWAVVTVVGDMIGEYNKRWKNAYKNSYWYLYENDPEFRSFYDNRAILKDEEKSVSLQLVDQHYGEFKVKAPVDGDSVEARNSRVYTALEKQGVLVSYYSQKGFSLPDFDLERLKQLWQMKADYMSWKPTEAETRDAKGFWGKVGRYVNPMTYVGWLGNSIKEDEYKETVQKYNLQKVFFNPDYVLIKKYLNYTTANKLKGGIYDAVGLRIEQSPFNYAPLIGIEPGAWNEALLKEAFAGDAFLIGQKEIVYLRQQVNAAADKAEEFIEDMDEAVAKIAGKDLPQTARIRKFLDALARAWAADPDKASDRLFADGRRIFGWRWTDAKKAKSPAAIITAFKKDIEKSLLHEPLSLAQKAAETVILMTTIKQQLDLAALMHSYIKEKNASLQTFNETFKSREVSLFLKDGTFLDVKGGTVSDWFSQIYSAYDETAKYLQLLDEDVTRFTGFADNANADSRDRLLWFDKEITHPSELLTMLNNELESWKSTSESWAEIGTKADLKVSLAENEEFADKVFKEFKLGYELEPLNPKAPLAEKSAGSE